eukprot:CAMPEP_0206492312 /NCGR_PEP_ID=MMETSP0324_2-20121206/45952_1 /ASSEMBLY_ACC=CAM_ASM_000836 /TAXON_ID=2866 /ORGANISM="Crypthecodinium cohnii, Strain Seligo" /LENGTH=31 /DNA_ID= /DNA_START= /DNA_END= /DNA_ORIENTATION=
MLGGQSTSTTCSWQAPEGESLTPAIDGSQIA